MVDHMELVAKRWYAEQRGRINGNTRSWDQLTKDQQYNIMDTVMDTLETMEETWTL